MARNLLQSVLWPFVLRVCDKETSKISKCLNVVCLRYKHKRYLPESQLIAEARR